MVEEEKVKISEDEKRDDKGKGGESNGEGGKCVEGICGEGKGGESNG